MASNGSRPPDSARDPTGKLEADVDRLRQDARNESAALEQEARNKRLQSTLEDQLTLPATVNQLQVIGATHTRRSFLDPILSPIIRDGQAASSTLGQLLHNLNSAVSKLERLEIFQTTPQVFLQRADALDPSAAFTDLNIDLQVHEAKRLRFTTGTSVGNDEGNAYGSLLWRNMFGGAEQLEVNAAAGTRTRTAYRAALSAPILSNPDLRIAIEGLTSATEKPWASHEELLKGGAIRFSWLSALRDVHTVEYSGFWRQITGLRQAASPTIRGDAGDTVKSAIKHTFTRERRDNPHLPQSGYVLKSAFEIAGVGPLAGDVAFSKGEVEVGGAVPVPLPGINEPTGISVGGGLRLGMLYPLPMGFDFGGKAQPSRVNDRFTLGGPTDVRGFQIGGLGPRDGQDGVGGDVFAAGSVNLLLPLPYKGPESALRFQVFANGGRLVALRNKGKSRETPGEGMDTSGVWNGITNAVRELGNGLPSVAAGCGLVYAHPMARLELNFSLPLVLRRGEQATKGIQVGVGISFL